jgi:hypothetical protein
MRLNLEFMSALCATCVPMGGGVNAGKPAPGAPACASGLEFEAASSTEVPVPEIAIANASESAREEPLQAARTSSINGTSRI